MECYVTLHSPENLFPYLRILKQYSRFSIALRHFYYDWFGPSRYVTAILRSVTGALWYFGYMPRRQCAAMCS